MQVINDVDFTGRTVDRYAILTLIRGGAQGRVYRGRDEVLNRDVAIKVLNANPDPPEGWRRDLIAEARALSRVSHPNVTGIYDFVTHDRRDFMVMEFIAGATLEEVVAAGPLPFREVVRLGSQLARGLAAAHAEQIAHCDIKPANLKITSSGILKIVDFGVAVRLRPEVLLGDAATTPSSVVGTLPYMAPEVLHGQRPDQLSDLFSAGAVLYEMATGCRAFPQTTFPDLVRAVDAGTVTAPSKINPLLPPAIDRVVLRAMDHAPSLRYRSADELAAALEELGANGAGTRRRSRLRDPWGRLGSATRRWFTPARFQLLFAPDLQPKHRSSGPASMA